MARISMVHFLTKERILPSILRITSEMPELEDEKERRYTLKVQNLQGLTSRGLQETLVKIKELADQHPYYKFNGMWNRQMESLSFCIVFTGWLGSFRDNREEGKLLSYDEVAKEMGGKRLKQNISNGSSN
jgi:hypothetical protein